MLMSTTAATHARRIGRMCHRKQLEVCPNTVYGEYIGGRQSELMSRTMLRQGPSTWREEGGTHASEGMPCSSFSQPKKLLKTQDAVWSFGAQSGSKIMIMMPPNTRAIAAKTANCWMRFAGTELTSPATSKQTARSATMLSHCGQHSLGHSVAPSHAEYKP